MRSHDVVRPEDLGGTIDDSLAPGPSHPEGHPFDEPIHAWDRDAALKRIDGDLPFLREMASMFVELLPSRLDEIREAVVAGEPFRINGPAHTLANWFGNFVALRAVAILRELEDLGRQGNMPGARMAFESLERETTRLSKALEQFARPQETTVDMAHSS